VVYEMLAGEPPYTGPTPQAIIMKRFTEPVPSVRRLRPEVPESVGRAVTRSLASVVTDRFTTAAEFGRALQPTASAPTTPMVVERLKSLPRLSPRRAVAVSAIMVLGFAVLFGMLSRERAATRSLDANVVAVAPFRVTSADPALAYLREGMVDLLAAKLTGRGAQRVATDGRR
jgi:eukaryotic-like serine/threonine-protein kinase